MRMLLRVAQHLALVLAGHHHMDGAGVQQARQGQTDARKWCFGRQGVGHGGNRIDAAIQGQAFCQIGRTREQRGKMPIAPHTDQCGIKWLRVLCQPCAGGGQ